MRFSGHGLSCVPQAVAAVIALAVLVANSGVANALDESATRSGKSSSSSVYIVQMSADPLASYRGGINTYRRTQPVDGARFDATSVESGRYRRYLESRQDSVIRATQLSQVVHRYVNAFNGFAAVLNQRQVERLRADPNVLRVSRSRLYELYTESTPQLLGLTRSDGAWNSGLTGEDVIIGIIDSGIWPEHRSFADVPQNAFDSSPERVEYGPPPAHWQGVDCAFGDANHNPNDAVFSCNRKILGASYFSDAIETEFEISEADYRSARDLDGHGSHVASTAAGNNGVYSVAEEVSVSGVAPRARIAVYKACWTVRSLNSSVCGEADVVAAVDQAVADGVDVINMSLGGTMGDLTDSFSISTLAANAAGSVVVAAAANSGPAPGIVNTVAAVPWVIGVGAVEQGDGVELRVSNGNSWLARGGLVVESDFSPSLLGRDDIFAKVVLADDGRGVESEVGCRPLDNAEAVRGNIVLVKYGRCTPRVKVLRAQAAGAVAVVVYNDQPGELVALTGSDDRIAIPVVAVSGRFGEALINYLATENDLSIRLRSVHTDTVAKKSSRGPNPLEPEFLFPDVVAPGTKVLAAVPPFGESGKYSGELFARRSGTSMASPHVAGAAALVRQLRPEWTPSEIMSALSMTAHSDTDDRFTTGELVFGRGSGLINPGRALSPGFVFPASTAEFRQYLCSDDQRREALDSQFCDGFDPVDASDLNLPYVLFHDLKGSRSATRQVRGVFPHQNGEQRPTSFIARVDALPAGIKVEVTPSVLSVIPGEVAEFQVSASLEPDTAVSQNWVSTMVRWLPREPLHPSQGRRDAETIVPVAVKPVVLDLQQGKRVADGNAVRRVSLPVRVGAAGLNRVELLGLSKARVEAGTLDEGEVAEYQIVATTTISRLRIQTYNVLMDRRPSIEDLGITLFRLRPDGTRQTVGSSRSFDSNERIQIANLRPGTYILQVRNYFSFDELNNYEVFITELIADENNARVAVPVDLYAGSAAGEIQIAWERLEPGSEYLGELIVQTTTGVVQRTMLTVRVPLL